MTRSKNQRWSGSRKRDLVFEILSGARTREQVRAEHADISEEELEGWISAYQRSKGNLRGMGMRAMIDARKEPVAAQ